MSARRNRVAGVLLHPTSLPHGNGVGDLGAEARDFADFLACSEVGIWQLLPLGPTGADGSPYGSWSAFAGNPLLIDLIDLVDLGLLLADEIADSPGNTAHVDYTAARNFKLPLVALAADRLLQKRGLAIDLFDGNPPQWLRHHANYQALRELSGTPWWQWPNDWSADNADEVLLDHPTGRKLRDRAYAVEWIFSRQMRALSDYCARLGVQLFGDVPIYVGADSADVWAHRNLFLLDDTGIPELVSGVPPDAFSETGQRWGNPLYDWPAHAATGFKWWIERLRRAHDLTSIVRIDHFRGLEAFWAIPADDEDAQGGRWMPGPGIALFDAIAAELGPVDIVAEDLGSIDAGVRALQQGANLPGMAILQFAFDAGADNAYLPHNLRAASVCYTGTHDNNTTAGWWGNCSAHVQDHVRRYFGVNGHDIAWDLIRAALASVCDRAIIPAQDILGFGESARMNLPGSDASNWSWRLQPGQLTDAHSRRLLGLIRLYDRKSRP